jgi:hypothetical protein
MYVELGLYRANWGVANQGGIGGCFAAEKDPQLGAQFDLTSSALERDPSSFAVEFVRLPR